MVVKGFFSLTVKIIPKEKFSRQNMLHKLRVEVLSMQQDTSESSICYGCKIITF